MSNFRSEHAGIDECVRQFGKPASRRDSEHSCRLLYEISDIKLTLDFFEGEMDAIRLEHLAPIAEKK